MATKRQSSRASGTSEVPLQIAVKLNPRAPKGLRELATPGGPIRLAPLIESLEPKQSTHWPTRAAQRSGIRAA
jgi:hypothetical protein